MTNFVLFLGAGFSRNWGGWLASEVFDYLISYPDLSAPVRDLLYRHRRSGGFEAALAELQENPSDPRLAVLQDAVSAMFGDMNTAYESVQFEPQNHVDYMIRNLLVRFDAIFTLNQDLLLERHYLNGNVELNSARRWDGWTIPGMKPLPPFEGPTAGYKNMGKWESLPEEEFGISTRLQPTIKLHGSCNWVGSSSAEMMIMGGNKPSSIKRHPVLRWYQDLFRDYLLRRPTRLMVIGYSFADDHINKAIANAVQSSGLQLFVVDPLGVDVIDKNREATIYAPDQLAEKLWPHVVGSSKRSLTETFGGDTAERRKMMRFFTEVTA